MSLQNQKFRRLNQKYIELCKKQGLNPSILKEIILYRSKGFNNTAIANLIGVHRVTVQNYVDKLRQMETEEFNKAVVGVLALIGGAYLLSELFKK